MNRWLRRPHRDKPAKLTVATGTTLAPGEERIFWTFCSFATGIAPPVEGRRWYRDPQGQDIEPLLERAGWPHREGPTSPPGAPPPDWRDSAAKGVETGIKVARVVAAIAIEAAGGRSGGIGDISVGPAKKNMDPALESDDFPVMVAAPGSMAASAPWQLDPDRRPQDCRLVLTCTTARLLFTGIQTQDDYNPNGLWTEFPRQLLWEVPRQDISSAQHRLYSRKEGDAIIRFTDGSWVRLDLDGNGPVEELVSWLADS